MMQFNKTYQRGFNLPEFLLVIVIGMSISYMGIRQYLIWRSDADASAARANINTIMQAMTKYYRQNCYGSTNPATAAVTPGTLNPTYVPSPTNTVPININTELNGNNLLPSGLSFNPLLKQAAGNPFSGYVAQFNLYPSHERRVCMQGTHAPSAGSDSCSTSASIGTIVNYTIQVAVLLKDTLHAQTYLRELQGDCLSNLAGNIVTPCNAPGHRAGPYVVWEREPSLVSSRDNSTYWSSLPNVNQFTQMYTTSNILVLTDGLATSKQTYLCGN